jgi:hypothetical protein
MCYRDVDISAAYFDGDAFRATLAHSTAPLVLTPLSLQKGTAPGDTSLSTKGEAPNGTASTTGVNHFHWKNVKYFHGKCVPSYLELLDEQRSVEERRIVADREAEAQRQRGERRRPDGSLEFHGTFKDLISIWGFGIAGILIVGYRILDHFLDLADMNIFDLFK